MNTVVAVYSTHAQAEEAIRFYGRELGDMGVQEFVNKKLVRVASMEAPA